MPLATDPVTPALSVRDLNRQARQLLDRHFDLVWVEGELSNVSRPASGHVYFTLKDDHTQVRCALFRNRAAFVRAPMTHGDAVRVQARVSLFEPRGDYQLIVEAVQRAGEGALLAALEALKQKLRDEGVFDNARPLPCPPAHLGIITSATGAALQDVLAVLRARWPFTPVSVFPVPVQGQDAAPAMIRALSLAARDGRCDALLLTRGGGSLEDLWAFNDEQLARAIHASPVPVMSAVGHEVDTTLADFAADARAPTPSAAAEQLTPDAAAIRQQLAALARRLVRAMEHTLNEYGQRLDRARLGLRHPGDRLAQDRRQLSQLEARMQRAIHQQQRDARRTLDTLDTRLTRQPPSRQLEQARALTQRLSGALHEAMNRTLQQETTRLDVAARQLNAVSPLATLSRGYAITENEQGHIIRQAQETTPGEMITVRLGEGRLRAEVKRRYKR
ncbi:exodeoxyribonuclease VII large subunit [Larsenimonas rhizosphaerae]|uniref:Exodeoxyribonuclease 7 large subunit n=1 Tax=Larsenimonas rhizosphaerae TaxID=2944682 RepID=A0AA41ZJ61_9GAMM|nr:exodeoxyribonuclease VII large subunit [Larsenimonas rhizosphaerae]MCX2522731.1 exodeoxyribonuclease VII large subunit [Larsenimonas rhizosphaerae]